MVEVQVRSKEKLYRGKTVEELKALDTREFAKLIKSRPRRAVMRNYDVIENFVKRCNEKLKKKKLIKTHNRSLVIVPALIGMTIHVHNGNGYVSEKINEEILGHRLGEFALTRKTVKHGAAGVGATKSSAALSVK